MLTLINLLIVTIAIALAAAFTILLIGKIGLRDFIIGHSRIKFISELFDCDFCLSFWLSLIISIVTINQYKKVTQIENSKIANIVGDN